MWIILRFFSFLASFFFSSKIEIPLSLSVCSLNLYILETSVLHLVGIPVGFEANQKALKCTFKGRRRVNQCHSLDPLSFKNVALQKENVEEVITENICKCICKREKKERAFAV